MDHTKLRPEEAPANASAADRLSEAKRALVALRLTQKRDERVKNERIIRIERHGLLPVSEQQRYLWFLHQVAPDVPTYNVPLALRLSGELDLAALHTALSAVVERHESLRTRFGDDLGVPYQIIDPPQPVQLDQVDLSHLPRPERDRQAANLLHMEAGRPFDLASGPVMHCWLARLAADEHLLLLAFHHIVTDGWSARLVAADLAELYAAAHEGRLPQLLPQDIQPVDYAAWQQQWLAGEGLEVQLSYWQERLANVPVMDLPTDLSRPLQPTGAGATFERDLAPDLGPRVQALASAMDVSLLALLLAAFNVVLHRQSGQSDLTVGSVFSGRTRSQMDPLVGFFANTLVLRTSLDGDPTFREFVAGSNEAVLGALGHQDLPFGTLVDRLNPDRVPGRNPLFQVTFTLVNESIAHQFQFSELNTEPVTTDTGTARFDLAVQVNVKAGGAMQVWTEFSTDLFRPARVERMVDQLEQVLAETVADPDQPVSGIQVLPPAERDLVLTGCNPPPHPFPDAGRLLCDVVSEWASRQPNAAAIRSQSRTITYRELDEASAQLAHLLRDQHGVGPDTVVGLLVDRGPDLPIGQLAVLRAGGAWLPLDPANPPARIAFQLEDAAARVVVTTTELAGLLPDGTTRLCLDEPDLRVRLAQQPVIIDPPTTQPDHLAYVIYTSGSTGTPKGVLVTHRAVVNFVAAVREMFALTPDDRVLQFANPAFDVSVFDVYAALGAGGTLVCAPLPVLLDPPELTRLMQAERVTVADLPPAVLSLLDPDELPELRALFVGLEAFPAELVNRFRTPRREFHNGYGPTETTIACVDYRCPEHPLTSPPPIGRAMVNSRAYVLNADLEPVPIGVPGQLFIAGTGLARGYVGRPDLTAERFLPCPFGEAGERMYATGDVVSRQPDGNMVFLGRVDRQVKIRGLRIELGEIEAALTLHPTVRQAVVVVHTPPGGPQLAAYVVQAAHSDGSISSVDPEDLRAHLSQRLPLHLVPATVTVLDALPLTPSGKLDQDRLPVPQVDARPHMPPSTPTEQAMAKIWQLLLDVDPTEIGVYDSFFGLGGNSLLATQLISRVRDTYGITLDPRQLFTAPMLGQLAELVDQAAALSEEELAEVDAELSGLSEEEIDRMLLAAEEGKQ